MKILPALPFISLLDLFVILELVSKDSSFGFKQKAVSFL